MLKLIVSNTEALSQVPPTPQRITTHTSCCANFTAEVMAKSPSSYVITARDSFNCLASEFTLEIEDREEEGELGHVVVCNFSPIVDDQLRDWTTLDETLIDIIVAEFQMKVLESLLLFCSAKNVANLVIQIDDADGDALGIYLRLAAYKDKIPKYYRKLIQLTIPINQKTFDKWDFWMAKVNQDFRYALWTSQRNSDVITYFKSHITIE
ncbi:MAG: hypothetical protein WCG04_03890 [Alphaproteobacteria bacterium]